MMERQRSLHKTIAGGAQNAPVVSAQKTQKAEKTQHTGICPKCGAQNDPNALFCENCGASLRVNECPNCGTALEPGVDYCEACNTYIGTDMCSFCSAPLLDSDTFCPECGASRDGIECPVCHAHSMFSFCKSCGTPLTEKAREMQQQAWDVPFLNQVRELEKEMEHLWLKAPVNNEIQRQRRQANYDIRNHVLALLEGDGEVLYERISEPEPLMNEAELEDLKEQKRRQLQELLNKMAMSEQPSPAQARLVAMACKPGVSRMAWQCNYKNALHTSPLGCACPQKGGKWIVLGSNDKAQIQNDK